MDIATLKEQLYNENEKVIKILEALGCGKIHYYNSNNEIRASIDTEQDSNPNSIRIKMHNLSTTSFSDRLSCSGDLINFVQVYKKYDKTTEAIKFICDVLGIEYNLQYKPKPIIFGGYFKGLNNNTYNEETPLKTYPYSVFDNYVDLPNEKFLKDGISLDTQLKYEIMYDLETNRICIPWYNEIGELVGIAGRYNGEDYEEMGVSKYFPIIAFPKSKCLYGYCQNYFHLTNNTIFIVEAEKSVMKADTEKFYNIVAIGSHNISNEQVRLIRNLNPKNVILVYDEDVDDEEFLKEQCNKFKSNISFLNNINTGYILDKNKKYLEKGSKKSPLDLGLVIFKEMTANCLKWVK